jgi:hypothetical protein
VQQDYFPEAAPPYASEPKRFPAPVNHDNSFDPLPDQWLVPGFVDDPFGIEPVSLFDGWSDGKSPCRDSGALWDRFWPLPDD